MSDAATPAAPGAASQGGSAVDGDAAEEEAGLEIDDIVPSHGYARLPVVGLGGSAGSIGALQNFFEQMPADAGLAFVVIVHLSPEHDSILSELLQRVTAMPVSEAQHDQKIQPNSVYVIPPGKHLSLADDHLRLADMPRELGRRAAVDLFFRSLADTHGAHASAIVLSGADGDGAIGIKRIKERGGLTIAQDPEESEHTGMPRSAIETGMVDWVLRVGEMPKRLVEYHARATRLQIPSEAGPNPAAGPRAASSNDEAALRDVLSFLRTRTSRDFSYYKRATIVRRIARRMQVNEVDDLPTYLGYLRTHPGETAALFQDLLISVTNFFRDKDAFHALEAQIPALFEGKTSADAVRVWVPACATGEEAYSIALLLCEHAATLEASPTLQVFATDLNDDVILTARNGLYPRAIVADIEPERLRRFFVKEHDGYRVRREIREMLLFAVHDLLKDSPFSRLDMVSCRNLLIYLNREAQQRAFDVFHFALHPGGRLFLGSSESVDDDSALFVHVDKKHRIYAPRPAPRAYMPVPLGVSSPARALGLRDSLDAVVPLLAGNSVPLIPRPTLPAFQDDPRASWGDLHFRLLERFSPPSLIVNGDFDIVHLSENAGRFLQFTGGQPSMNLLRAVHPMLRVDVRAALHQARQTSQTASALSVPMEVGHVRNTMNIHVSPAHELAPDFFLVVFDTHAAAEGDAENRRDPDDPAARHLERELERTKRHLRDLVEQHEGSTEELKASNEELQAMNEELRSATEELETSREELQSINEELTTVNQELKGKVDELGHANSDLHNLMGATAIATLFLDRELRIMRFTPPAVDLFSLIGTDIGRPLADLQHRLAYPELIPDAARVLDQLIPIEREVGERGGRFFLARLLPYRTTEDRIAGIVLTFVDVTERHLAQDSVRRAHEDLEVRVGERTAELDAANAALRNEVVEHQRAEKLRQELQSRLVTAQEEERRRISRELHDEVGQQLTALMLSLKALEDAVQGQPAEELRSLRATADRAAREIHQLATELRPITLDDLGLARALESYVESWSSRTGINVDLLCAGLDGRRLPNPVETTLYRIVQEALNNVWKHARAGTVSVSIEWYGGYVLGVIEDDGQGFDSATVDGSGADARIGIAGMRERAAIVGGELTVESGAGRGTTVHVKIPAPPTPPS